MSIVRQYLYAVQTQLSTVLPRCHDGAVEAVAEPLNEGESDRYKGMIDRHSPSMAEMQHACMHFI